MKDSDRTSFSCFHRVRRKTFDGKFLRHLVALRLVSRDRATVFDRGEVDNVRIESPLPSFLPNVQPRSLHPGCGSVVEGGAGRQYLTTMLPPDSRCRFSCFFAESTFSSVCQDLDAIAMCASCDTSPLVWWPLAWWPVQPRRS